MESKLYIKRLTPNAIFPSRASSLAAGYDLYSAVDTVIPARGNGLVKTDLSITIPEGCYGRIAPRSGLALNHGIDVGAGVIDRDYTGNVGIVLFNHRDTDFNIWKGDRVAQLVCEQIKIPELVETDEMMPTIRGGKGFGSTGLK
jgi:deoxyuridine 5'-triphosphate nucleotidohydrolase